MSSDRAEQTRIGHSNRSTIERFQLNNIRVFLLSIVFGACVDAFLQIEPLVYTQDDPATLQELVTSYDPLQTAVNSWFYGVLLFPIVWLALWWHLSGRPLPEPITSRSYVRPIRLLTVATVPFVLLSISATAGLLTNSLAPAILYLFGDVPSAILAVTMQLVLLLLLVQPVLGVLIWFDYRHIQRQSEYEIRTPWIEIYACMLSFQFFGLLALWAGRRYLKNRKQISLGVE